MHLVLIQLSHSVALSGQAAEWAPPIRWQSENGLYRDIPNHRVRGKARREGIAREVRERLDPLIRRKKPLDVPVKKPKATWVEPVVDAEIEFSGITNDRLLRAAVFKGCARISRKNHLHMAVCLAPLLRRGSDQGSEMTVLSQA
jgi:hypothetical protein